MRIFFFFLIACHVKKTPTLEDHLYYFLDKKDQLFYQGFLQALNKSLEAKNEKDLRIYLEEFFKHRRVLTHDFSSFFLEKEELTSLSKDYLNFFKNLNKRSQFKDYLKSSKKFFQPRPFYYYSLWKFAEDLYTLQGKSISFKEELIFFLLESLEESSELVLKKTYETIYQKMIISLKRLYDKSQILFLEEDFSQNIAVNSQWSNFGSITLVNKNLFLKQEKIDLYIDDFAKDFYENGPVKKKLYPKTKSILKELLKEKTFEKFIDRIFFLFKDYEDYYPKNFISFFKETCFKYLD